MLAPAGSDLRMPPAFSKNQILEQDLKRRKSAQTVHPPERVSVEMIDLELGDAGDHDLLGDPRSLGPFRPGVTKTTKKKKGQTKGEAEMPKTKTKKQKKKGQTKIQEVPPNSKVLLWFLILIFSVLLLVLLNLNS